MTKGKGIPHDDIGFFRSLFVARKDAYVKWQSGSDEPVAVRDLLDDDVLAAHLRGHCRVATYLVSPNARTPFLVFDLDVPSKKLLRKIIKRLRRYGATPYVETSKSRGFHIWVFFDKPLRAAKARKFAKVVLEGIESRKIEIFPKQDEVPKGRLGNCIFLPLFRADAKEGRTVFLDEDFAPHRDQWAFLRSIRRTPTKIITKACREAGPSAKQTRGPAKTLDGPIRETKRNITLTSLGGTMRNRGMSAEAIEAALFAENAARCEPALPDEEVKRIVRSIERYEPGSAPSGARDSQATRLVALADDIKLFHTPETEAFGSWQVAEHEETYRLRDRKFKDLLASRFYKQYRTTPPSQAVQDALSVLEGKATHEGPQREVFVRLAEWDSAIYLDLGDASWQAVKITAGGWEVVPSPPVKFRRPRGLMPLPIPQRGETIEALRPFTNVATDDDFRLLVGWLVAALQPRGPYAVLVLQGETGSAKTTTDRVLRQLVDPNSSPERSAPRDMRDLMIAARNSWVVAFDNLSYLRQWLSDALCRLATGGGFSTRELYTDDEEKLFEATRPVLLNGIEGVVTKSDLFDRAIVLYLPVMAPAQRKTEQQFWADFEGAQPYILGALLDAVSCALRRWPSVRLDRSPRMADFARWVVAAEPTLGWPEGGFMAAYDQNRETANSLVLEASPVAPVLRRVCAERNWEGTAAELLRKLNKYREQDEEGVQRDWPRSAWALSRHLRTIAPNLRATGLDVRFGRKTPGSGSKRIITIKWVETVPPDAAAQLRPGPDGKFRFPRLPVPGPDGKFRFPRLSARAL